MFGLFGRVSRIFPAIEQTSATFEFYTLRNCITNSKSNKNTAIPHDSFYRIVWTRELEFNARTMICVISSCMQKAIEDARSRFNINTAPIEIDIRYARDPYPLQVGTYFSSIKTSCLR